MVGAHGPGGCWTKGPGERSVAAVGPRRLEGPGTAAGEVWGALLLAFLHLRLAVALFLHFAISLINSIHATFVLILIKKFEFEFIIYF